MTLSDCHENFQEYIADLAAKQGKAAEQVFGWWREYSATCDGHDQSPVKFEFELWYADELKGGAS
jgi:hypothetical protein